MTPLGLLNFLVLQWLGIRLARCSCEVAVDPALADLMRAGAPGWATRVNGWTIVVRESTTRGRPDILRRLQWWALIGPIVPLTGWWSPYIPRRQPTVLARFGDYPSCGERP